MRSVQAVALVALSVLAAPASAARGVASATIVVPAIVMVAAQSGDSPSVSIETLRDGAWDRVTVAFN